MQWFHIRKTKTLIGLQRKHHKVYPIMTFKRCLFYLSIFSYSLLTIITNISNKFDYLLQWIKDHIRISDAFKSPVNGNVFIVYNHTQTHYISRHIINYCSSLCKLIVDKTKFYLGLNLSYLKNWVVWLATYIFRAWLASLMMREFVT